MFSTPILISSWREVAQSSDSLPTVSYTHLDVYKRQATTNVVARFWNTNGRPVYNQLRIKTTAGKRIKLPSVPSVKGYRNLGWSTRKNATKIKMCIRDRAMSDGLLEDLVQVLLFHEISRRRCRRRRCRGWY